MTIEYDEKGKIYTNVVPKDPISAVIKTVTHLVKGAVYVRQGDRLKDELDRCDKFLPVTNAAIYDSNGEILRQTGFMLVNLQHIIWILPEDEKNPTEGAS